MFYVYEHWRPDRDEPFYVGKGKGGRANMMRKRNKHHVAIQEKLHRLSMAVEVRLISSGLTEQEAFDLEIQRIAMWRAAGIDLSNIALGGGTNSGYTLSEERKANIGRQKKGNKYRLGATLSEETKEKIRKAHLGKSLSEQHKEKLKERLSGVNNPFYGKFHSAEVLKSISNANKSRIWTEASKNKLSESLKARPKCLTRKKGWKLSEETKSRQSEAAKLRWVIRKLSDAT
jgi:hypothetical protein